MSGKKDTEESIYTLDNLTKKCNPHIKEILMELRNRILSLSDSVWEKVGSYYVDYRTLSTFVSVDPQKSKIKILIKMGSQRIEDPEIKTSPIPKTFRYGHLNTVFELNSMQEIDYSMKLIKQAYQFVTG